MGVSSDLGARVYVVVEKCNFGNGPWQGLREVNPQHPITDNSGKSGTFILMSNA